MTLFAINRTVEADMDRARSEAMVFRAFECALAYEGLGWIRSYMRDEARESLCIYAAQSEEDIWDHARRAALPIDAVHEVDEFLPERFGVSPRHSPEGSALYVIDRQMPETTTPQQTDAAAMRAADCAPDFPGISWVRSFWDEEQKLAHCLYWATSPGILRAHAARARIPCDKIQLVEEVLPADLGLPPFQTPVAKSTAR